MTIEELEHLAKRKFSDGEIAEIGKVLALRHLHPRDERERRWVYLRAIRSARVAELGLKVKKLDCANESSR
jgi:hypothetical protein